MHHAINHRSKHACLPHTPYLAPKAKACMPLLPSMTKLSRLSSTRNNNHNNKLYTMYAPTCEPGHGIVMMLQKVTPGMKVPLL